MLLGFISLLLAVSQTFTTEICVPRSLIQTMLPCKSSNVTVAPTKSYNRRLLVFRRDLASDTGNSTKCIDKGKMPILSGTDIHDLHMFIFILAVVHISYSLATVYLGGRKVVFRGGSCSTINLCFQIHAWKKWEADTQADDVQTMPANRETKFIRRHVRNSSFVIGILVTLLQQFGWSVTKEDYYTLRHTFIINHSKDNSFDFHAFLKTAIAQDFKTVIGMSEYFWVYVIVFFLLNVHGWHTYFWISFVPILVLILLGAKLQYILGTLAVDILKAPGEPVQVRDKFFWFGTPRILLHLLHFSIFQNAFELALLFWMWASFGWHSCLIDNKTTAILHVSSGILILIQCSYTTLPLYALLSQMGPQNKGKHKNSDVPDPTQPPPGELDETNRTETRAVDTEVQAATRHDEL
ncbi:MLO-like protein 1 [Selaginella moellendorffii]|uniref:MLO-like protein 1 n=1 Tax=Selaginella moellendorffii TaxID=88036 RepID=UPI000D1D11F4|nr:MLO-like protein 1 [Selaginella moellendorffii]|eukprot:XP_024524382.1 MLO-like protein 1 [Selaginella moellendorffii]